MSPDKAIIIVLILFLIVAFGFVLLYLNKQSAVQESFLNSSLNQAGQGNAFKSPALLSKEVEKIIEAAGQNPTPAQAEEARKEIVNTVNSEIVKQEQAKTPMRQAQDQQAEAARQKIIDQINSQIKQNLKK